MLGLFRKKPVKSADSFSLSNVHPVIDEITVHAVVTDQLDPDHRSARMLPLVEVTDEQLLAELSHRKLDVKYLNSSANITTNHDPNVTLKKASNEALLSEVNRRKIDIMEEINEGVIHHYYEGGKKIGDGASGEVFVCRPRGEDGEIYACKIVHKDSEINDAQSMSTEIEIMKRLRHGNIVALHEIFESPTCFWIILEYVDGGNLRTFLTKYFDRYTELMAAVHTKQILDGVSYLHSRGIVHRDLKMENILLKKVPLGDGMIEYVVKIADFGLSALMRFGEKGYDPSDSVKRKEFKLLTEVKL
jgi:serine/threonine protein kinase